MSFSSIILKRPHYSCLNSVSHKIQLCEKDELQGQMLELTSDSLSVPGYIHPTEIFFLNVLDQPDLHAHLNHCNSVKVETGCWTTYECPNYIGHQYFLRKGDYPDYQHLGFNDSISTCIITAVSSPYCLHVYYCLY
uniref:Beta/gamma crystallin 'Greek key' domain-containing protein n=1 Tax=Strix occidentalis caurina TaxID=311401 RepID=A0A8D0L059_STROC